MRRTLRYIVPIAVLVLVLAMPLTVAAAPPAPVPAPAPAAPPVPPAPPATLGPAAYVVAPLGLRLRTEPNLAAPVILGLWNGETVYVSGDPTWVQGIAWVNVQVYRWGVWYQGYCASAYLSNYAGWSPTGETGLQVTATAGLRLRSGPGTGYAIQRIVPYGTIVQPTGAATVWANGYEWEQVTFDGTTVWAAKTYLSAI